MATLAEKQSIYKTLIYYFLHKNPVAFRDYYMPRALRAYFKTRYYQIPAALSKDAILKGGRRYGKSKDLEPRLCQYMLNNPVRESLLTAFRRVHIQERMDAIISYFQRIPLWRSMLKGGSTRLSVKKTPIYQIELNNGHIAYGISVGDDPLAVNVQGKSPVLRMGEEFASYPEAAWKQLVSTQHPSGCDSVYGGTTDGRIDTPFATVQKSAKFKGKVFAISRRLEPHFCQEDKQTLIDNLGGEDSDDFLQQVDALDGEPTFSPWNLTNIADCMKNRNPIVVEMEGKEYVTGSARIHLSGLPMRHHNAKEVIIAVDLGWTQPSVIGIWEYINSKWRLTARVMAYRKMISQHVEEIIDFLADRYDANIIPIDCTNNNAVATGLQKSEMYKGKDYENRVVWVEFNSSLPISITRDPETGKEKVNKVNQKILSTNILRDFFGDKNFDLPMDEDIMKDFDSEKEKIGVTGRRLIVTPPNVHITELFRCFAIGWFLKHGYQSKRTHVNYQMVFPKINAPVMRSTFGRRTQGVYHGNGTA